jgi:sugar/nucleoside kinase (ribokinase family)
MYDVITFGGATRDIFLKTGEGLVLSHPEDEQEKLMAFKYGQKIITDDAYFSFGGGAFNASISFKKMGLSTGICINIGRDESAKSIIDKLEDTGVDTSLVMVDKKNHTALSVLILDNKDHIAFLHRGANNFLTVCDPGKIKNSKWFYISSLTGHSAEVLSEIVRVADKNNIKVAINPGSTQLNSGHEKLKSILDKIELIILNREEAEELICNEESCEAIEDNKILLHRVQKLGPRRVIITEGEKGSYYSDNDLIYFEPAFKKDGVVDTTGAGDAFGSTFVAGIIKGMSIPLAQRTAAINAAHVTECVGAQEGLLTHKQIEDKLKKIKVIN